MPVILETSIRLPKRGRYHWRVAIGASPTPLDDHAHRPGLAADIERAYEAATETWLSLGKSLGRDPEAFLAYMPACMVNTSDFGLMLAWCNLVKTWAESDETTLVVCDDPWLFRQLQEIKGVTAGRAPWLWPRRLRLSLRGLAARLFFALRMTIMALYCRSRRGKPVPDSRWLIVHDHAAWMGDVSDPYFGPLMERFPALRRLVNINCPLLRVAELTNDPRNVVLHAWGSPIEAILYLPFARWRPAHSHCNGPLGWLIRRAQHVENGTGYPAFALWQQRCLALWLQNERPRVIVWPWENQSWERVLTRMARSTGSRTIGYQHTVVGRHMLNYAAGSNPDGLASLPDRIVCTGRSTASRLRKWAIPADRLAIGGALRFQGLAKTRTDSAAPFFLALPFDSEVSAEMVATAKVASAAGFRFLVKCHPIYRYTFDETPEVRQTETPLGRQESVAGVIYAATTVGLEAALLGIPTLRFRSSQRIAIDILPDDVTLLTADRDDFVDKLRDLTLPPKIDPDNVFAPIDWRIWEQELDERIEQTAA